MHEADTEKRIADLEHAVAALSEVITRISMDVAQHMKGVREHMVTERLTVVNAAGEPVVVLQGGEEGEQAVTVRSDGVAVATLAADDQGGLMILNDFIGRHRVAAHVMDTHGIVTIRRGDDPTDGEVFTPRKADSW